MEKHSFTKNQTVKVQHSLSSGTVIEDGKIVSVGSKNIRVEFSDGGELTFPLSTLQLGNIKVLKA